MSSTDTTTDPRIDAIAEQRRVVVDVQRQHEEAVARETRRLAELIVEATSGDDSISYTQAGEAMGLSKTYAYGLATKLREGRL